MVSRKKGGGRGVLSGKKTDLPSRSCKERATKSERAVSLASVSMQSERLKVSKKKKFENIPQLAGAKGGRT